MEDSKIKTNRLVNDAIVRFIWCTVVTAYCSIASLHEVTRDSNMQGV